MKTLIRFLIKPLEFFVNIFIVISKFISFLKKSIYRKWVLSLFLLTSILLNIVLSFFVFGYRDESNRYYNEMQNLEYYKSEEFNQKTNAELELLGKFIEEAKITPRSNQKFAALTEYREPNGYVQKFPETIIDKRPITEEVKNAQLINEVKLLDKNNPDQEYNSIKFDRNYVLRLGSDYQHLPYTIFVIDKAYEHCGYDGVQYSVLTNQSCESYLKQIQSDYNEKGGVWYMTAYNNASGQILTPSKIRELIGYEIDPRVTKISFLDEKTIIVKLEYTLNEAPRTQYFFRSITESTSKWKEIKM